MFYKEHVMPWLEVKNMARVGIIRTLLKQGLPHLKVCSRLWTDGTNCGSAVMKNKDGLTIFTRNWLTDSTNPK